MGDLEWCRQSIMAVIADPDADHLSGYYDMPLEYAVAA
jgi:hypothetical protein